MMYQGPKEIKYLFIDGGYLRKVIESFGEKIYCNKNIRINYSRIASGYTKVFYYDCLPKREDAFFKSQEEFFSVLRGYDGWHVILGIVTGSAGRLRQKEVDIRIAVDMLSHSHKKNMHKITFIAGDRDFKPLVDAVVREGMFIELMFERLSVSKELMEAADARVIIDPYTIQRWFNDHESLAYYLPNRGINSDQYPSRDNSHILLAKGLIKNGNELNIYKYQEKYWAIHQFENRNYCHYNHEDLDFLKKIILHTIGNVDWIEHES